MNVMAMMYVVIGGAMGSLCRYLACEMVSRYNATDFPYATLIVNVVGAFLMGLWIAIASVMAAKGRDPHDLHLLIAIGALGGFTTFSAFSLDVFVLMQRGLAFQSALYIAGSLVLTMLGLIGGMWLAKLIAG